MAGSKRSRSIGESDERRPSPPAPLPPKKPAYLSTKSGLATAFPSPTSALDDDEHHDSLIADNGGKSDENSLTDQALVQEVLKIVANESKAKVMILESMRKYSFNLLRLKELLRENHLEVSFSKVEYTDIAPLVGLQPHARGNDIRTFDMFRARLPNHVFNGIIRDLGVFSKQYGPVGQHQNEEARSRYLSAYFNQIVAMFGGLLFNTPETILEGRITTKGRIEYQFQTYGGITVVFIEVKLDIGSSRERLNCVAQVITECGACAWMNYQRGYQIPILAVLCDGNYFYFFKFIDRHGPHKNPLFLGGKYANGHRVMKIEDIDLMPTADSRTYFQQIRQTCESFYYIFLIAYQCGLEAYWQLSLEKSRTEGKGRESTPRWHRAVVYAKAAVDEALLAWRLIDQGDVTGSMESAERAAELLAESVEEAPFTRHDLFSEYTEDMANVP
ncbi:uncharacterized protein Z518_03901 [Rhinocladiella mackenziei CBS 650.93]|uniref:Uncharacterized protein n=1 Tax=Rhinocladiella mackenziei CBS 650.93 TaxID=1442369 RepID=A0A0D2FV03_9EURO|nr:uncharacterized protein Z518_03901 [Rhinocladiella mackenziei CBS 650.93]KIX05927.1 hypothetical protein Z518_03901 [Rhinocladiella mackenziei CBS 650.93]